MTFSCSRTARRARLLRSQRRYTERPPSGPGGHAPTIEQLGPPSSRACSEGSHSLRLQAEFGKGCVRVSRRSGQRVGENPAVEAGVLLRGQLAQLLQRVPLRQRRHIHQVAGGGTAEQRQSFVGGHLLGVQHPAKRQLHRFPDACIMGDLHHDGSPVGHGHREAGEPRSTPINPHLGAFGTQGHD